ncbi:MAG: M67 family metallopeptidase [Anaerolineae bacterium]|nr:M67 family metallopeptidase [Anaerolineae bacterium]
MPERLWLPPVLVNTITQHAHSEFPREACGIIGGKGEQAQRVIPVANIASDPIHHYRMDERALTQTLFRLEAEGLSLIGFYHSHPQGDPIPSPTDVREAHYPHTVYLIVGLRHSPLRMAAWEINHGEVLPVELLTGDTPPLPSENRQFTAPQRAAIIISVTLAFVFVILLSLSLLPPAPPIP